jgi:putative ABC transport system ATP-binding protein
MNIVLDSILPTYISNAQVSSSEIFLKEKVTFESPKKYLINANSGVGKTSFLNLIFAINFSYNGNILYDNINIKSNSNLIQKLRRETISYVFQDFKLFPNISAIDNIILKNNLTNYKTNSQISEMFEYCGIFEQKDKLVKNLSRGQKQRVAIIRSLCQPFNFLLLDEPFSHLDSTNTAKVVSLINSEVSMRSASLIMTDLRINSFFNYDEI